ncbi:MAG: DUF1559 domain-containing protein [Planctomycetales bacterium]|nr:DUF1559 domain-containing protein [Planctomycetales bacterium]
MIAVIGILAALLLPAIQQAREASRRTACQNNLRQLSVAMLAHHDNFQQFPSGGWGHYWLPMAGRGSGPRQPGGWAYSLLPFVEQSALHQSATGQSPSDYDALLTAPQCLWNCPTRRRCAAWPIFSKYAHPLRPLAPTDQSSVVRGDYAVNSGATARFSCPGPPDLPSGDDGQFSCPEVSLGNPIDKFALTGVSHLRIAVSLRQIADGASNTYLVGEKYVFTAHYETGESLGDKESLFSGYCVDNHRFAAIELPPLSDAHSEQLTFDQLRFGSAHPGGLNMSRCDASVRWTDFAVDPEIHFRAGHIADADAPAP